MINSRNQKGFTLIELITVIAIILILMGLLFPALSSVKESARRVQVKNDVLNIVTAIKAYYTEYGKYPTSAAADVLYSTDNSDLFNTLRLSGTSNPRGIVFIEVPTARDQTPEKAKSGLDSAGVWHDPWGSAYYIAIDGDYDNQILTATHKYNDTGFATLNTGVIAWSLGKDKTQGSTTNKNTYSNSDDIISWQ